MSAHHELEVRLLDPRYGDSWPLPAYATAASAGMDLRAALEVELVLAPGDGTGLIDADYQGPLLISVWNRGREAFTIQPGDRIAQLVLAPIVRATLKVVDTFAGSARGEGGFGHTGVR